MARMGSMRWVASFGVALLASSCTKADAPSGSPSVCAQAPSQKSVCFVFPGEYPPPDCDPSAGKCSGGQCSINETKCGSTSTCLPLADNATKSVFDFRIRRLNIAAPDALAATTVQQTVVTDRIDFDSAQCGEKGTGLFNWLIRVDRAHNALTTGGAPPSADPFGTGYCFANFTASGLDVKPQSVATTFRGSSFSTTPIAKLTIPIFVGPNSPGPILLPLTNATFRNVTLSGDSNCIGALNPSALAADCSDDPSQCGKWKTAGVIAAHITLEEADAVNVSELNESLCVLLTKSAAGPDRKCVRQGGRIVAQGDYCSSSELACDCRDSFWLAATFAASAVTINDGSTVTECGGTPR